MKKLIFLSLLWLFFITGCSNTLPSNVDPEIQVSLWTWTMLAEFGSEIKNEISRTDSEEEKINGRKESVISWYIYTYIYKDLWLKISTSPLYPPYFFEKESWLIFKRKGNIIYSIWSSDEWAEYIQVLTKDPNIYFYDQIKKKHLPTGCKIDLFTWYNYNFLSNNNKMVSIIFSDISFPENTCIAHDTSFPKNPLFIVFFYNPKNPSIYYKISFGDACAPGPCSIFWNIEFF